MRDDYRRGEPGKGLHAVEMRAVGELILPIEFVDADPRPNRIEALDHAEGDIGQGGGDENAPDGDGHGRCLRAAPMRGVREDSVQSRRPVNAYGGRQSIRMGMPASAMRSLASRMVYSPKWKIEAASTALAWPWRTPATR